MKKGRLVGFLQATMHSKGKLDWTVFGLNWLSERHCAGGRSVFVTVETVCCSLLVVKAAL